MLALSVPTSHHSRSHLKSFPFTPPAAPNANCFEDFMAKEELEYFLPLQCLQMDFRARPQGIPIYFKYAIPRAP